MSTGARWIRLDVGWDNSEWVMLLEPAAQLAWVKLLCHVKLHGKAGRVKAMTHVAAAKKWYTPVQAVRNMVQAAAKDGALSVVEGDWVVTKWNRYQEPDGSAAARKRRQREREAALQNGPRW